MHGGRHCRTRGRGTHGCRPYDHAVPGSIQSIERAAAVLRLIATSRSALGLAEVSAALRLAKGTAHGILRTLESVEFVEQDRVTGRYQLSAGLLDMGSGHVDTNELRARSLNWTDPLASRTCETVRVGVLLNGEVLVVHHVFRPDESQQTADVGAVLPAHATALGKLLLAYDPGTASTLAGELAAFTTRTITDPDRLTHEFVQVRSHGYALEFGEYSPEQASIAAPIHGYGGLVLGAVAIHGHLDRLCDTGGRARPGLVAEVRRCARSITRDLQNSRTSA
jgi:DNA-binding IclR family transcriptional regulator